MKKLLLLALFGLLSVSLSGAETANWTEDYAAALARAKAEKRQVFLLFTGSDWCIWCKRLHAEILSTPAFERYAAEHLVLVMLDFPRRKPQADAIKAQNQQLATHYEIEGYPTVIVLNPDGQVAGTLGYQEGGPEPFLKELRKL